MDDLGVTIAGEPFPHLIYHFVLTYSNVEAASICFSENIAGAVRSLLVPCGRPDPNLANVRCGAYAFSSDSTPHGMSARSMFFANSVNAGDGSIPTSSSRHGRPP